MGERDHSIKCETCGLQRGGLNDYKCDCDEERAAFAERAIENARLTGGSVAQKQDLPPRLVVIDLVLKYSAVMPKLGSAAVLQGSLLIATRNHQGNFVGLGTPVNFDGDPFDGSETEPPRFVLRRIGATVWKLAPSIKHDLLHAFVTVVDVPPAVAWVPVTDEQIIELFARHCECRPVDTARMSHSHDCDTLFTNACREALHDHSAEARARAAKYINEERPWPWA